MRGFSGRPRRLEWACCSLRPGPGQAGRTPRALNLRVSGSPSPPPGTPAQKEAGPAWGPLLRPSCIPQLPRSTPDTLPGAHRPGMVRFVPELVQGRRLCLARGIWAPFSMREEMFLSGHSCCHAWDRTRGPRQGSRSWSPSAQAQSEPSVWPQKDKHVFCMHSVLKGESVIFLSSCLGVYLHRVPYSLSV